MVTTIPVPIQFSLPDGWRSAPPDEVGVPEAAFVALHPATSQGFTANITITGEERSADVPLEDIAADAAAKLEAATGMVQIGRQSTMGSPENPALTQAVRTRIKVNGEPRDVVQLQVFLGMQNADDASRRAVLHIALTATPEQFEKVIGDFQKFLKTIKPEQGVAQ
ncbi:hypothetical protein Lesp02_69440 [Lentzea sp. NBRC 105346]|uniref:hypothetical protein n=1 Tax=Lentzea sp. NBRC 105346 TaxID=3032205 RepID=UPI0024A5378C|nr:hypothetical protein [Lentzea sp. NBRC 105346]GLZ34757.1 hypothetical protein Lesp02_69440 [Lentzea sp. NBRC 105346]